MIRPAVNWAISAPIDLKTTNQPLEKLQVDISSFTEISDDLQLGKDTWEQLETLLASHVDALSTNIKITLEVLQKAIEAYAIFDLLLLPPSDDDIFKEYGDAEVKILSNQFF